MKANETISNKTKRKHLIDIIKAFLNTNVALMEYYHNVAPDRKGKLACRKSIKTTNEAIYHLDKIEHIEILEYLYSSFIGNNVIAYSISGSLVLSKEVNRWDTTEEGFLEFKDFVEEQKQKKIAKEQERQKTLDAVKKAKEEGKKVEMVWDKDTKTVKPLIIEEKSNA